MRLASWGFVILFAASAAGETIDLSRSIEPGQSVRVDIEYGQIRIRGAEAGTLTVSGRADEDVPRLSADDAGGAVEIKIDSSFWQKLKWWTDESTHRVELLIELPRDTPLFVVSKDASIEIEGVSGPIGVGVVSSMVTVRGEPEWIDFEGVSGSLDFDGQTERLKASTLTGALRAAGLDGDVGLEAVSGPLSVQNVVLHSAKLTTVSGDILVEGRLSEGARLSVDTESGEVRLQCDSEAGIDYDLETTDGEILDPSDTREPTRDSHGARILKFRESAGGSDVRVRTRSGHIWLLPREAPQR